MITPASPYYAQVRLLVRVLPVVAKETCFALKGGTALNLFVRDMPRLSVDIDLAYVPARRAGRCAGSDRRGARPDRCGTGGTTVRLSRSTGKAAGRAAALPAVRWKLMNIAAMSAEQHRHAVTNLERILEQI